MEHALSADYDYSVKLTNFCKKFKCQPSQVWTAAYESGCFTLGEYLAEEEERLGIDLTIDDTVTWVLPGAAE